MDTYLKGTNGSDDRIYSIMKTNECNQYKKVARKELDFLFAKYNFSFSHCEVFKSGEHCFMGLTSEHGKLMIHFERGSTLVLLGHPKARFDWRFFDTQDTYWFFVREVVAFLTDDISLPWLSLDKWFSRDSYSSTVRTELEIAKQELVELSEELEPVCSTIFQRFRDDSFYILIEDLVKWRKLRDAEFEKLINKQYQLK